MEVDIDLAEMEPGVMFRRRRAEALPDREGKRIDQEERTVGWEEIVAHQDIADHLENHN